MRLVEVACIPVYIYQILFSIELLSVAIIRTETIYPSLNPYIIGDPDQMFAVQCSRE